MNKINDVSDKRKAGMSLKEFEDACKKNMKNLGPDGTIFACACGSREFHLLQHPENFKSICCKCGNIEILAWNGSSDSSTGAIRRLDTMQFYRPMKVNKDY